MMLTPQQASHFATQWLAAFNAHNLETILDHYADDVEFYSPFIQLLQVNESGCISGKAALRAYFQRGLAAYPDLYFNLHQVLTGVDTLAIYYTSVNGWLAAEVFQLNEAGLTRRVFCHYTSP